VRIVRWVFVCCAVLLSSGCAIWESETTNRGGYLDHLLDEHWIKADSQRMRALRAFALQVSLARIASVSSKNDSDRQLLAIRIGATTKRALPVLACALDGTRWAAEIRASITTVRWSIIRPRCSIWQWSPCRSKTRKN
jgi:hypothetical protein